MNDHDWCESNLSPNHSDDRLAVYYGAEQPRHLCGYHAMREGYTS